jgi:hypothetical protein
VRKKINLKLLVVKPSKKLFLVVMSLKPLAAPVVVVVPLVIAAPLAIAVELAIAVALVLSNVVARDAADAVAAAEK